MKQKRQRQVKIILAVFVGCILIGSLLAMLVISVGEGDHIFPTYYDLAENCVKEKYGNVNNQTIGDLGNFLMQIEPFPVYDNGVFDCSEASAFLEWLLEGAGFSASIVYDPTFGKESGWEPARHAWVTVDIQGENRVNVDATVFCKNFFHCRPGLFIGTFYGNPLCVFTSLPEAVKTIGISEWDWWNIQTSVIVF